MTRIIKTLETKTFEELLRELGMFSLQQRRVRGNSEAIFKYLKGRYREDGGCFSSSSVAPDVKT